MYSNYNHYDFEHFSAERFIFLQAADESGL